MALHNSGQVWFDEVKASVAIVKAWFKKDGSGNFYATHTDYPKEGALLDLDGSGVYVLTDVSAGYPASFAGEMFLLYTGTTYLTYT